MMHFPRFPALRAWRSAILAAAAAATLGAHGAEPVVTVSVLPRIGLFNEVQYVRTNKREAPPLIRPSYRAGWTPMTQEDFHQAIAGEAVAALIAQSLPAGWEILTTYDPARHYERRKVRIRLADPAGGRVESCRVFVDGSATVGTRRDDGCELGFDLHDNGARSIPVSYRLAGAAEAAQVPARVPEDYLFVIAGDSYASGEGNPDRPCSRRSLLTCGTPALWMDEECHRSFWSAGMRTALRMIQEDRAGRRGAYTVVNVACSGAGMAEGVVQGYGGVVKLQNVVSRHQESLRLDPGGLVLTGRKITPQLEVIEEVVQRRPAGQGVDLLVMSAGGNDLQFGAVVVDSIVGNHGAEWAEQTGAHLRARLRTYRHAFNEFARRLKDIRVDRVVWIPYPNVTDIGGEGESAAGCASGPLGAADGFDMLGIDQEERRLAHRSLVTLLNGDNQDYTARERYLMLSRHDLDRVYARRGWCAEDDPKGPYVASTRLVRKADESIKYQGALHGAMHPTFEGHRLVSELIDELLRGPAAAAR